MPSRKIQVGMADDDEPISEKERALQVRLDKMLADSETKKPDVPEPAITANSPKKVAITFDDAEDEGKMTHEQPAVATDEAGSSNTEKNDDETDPEPAEQEPVVDEAPRPVPQLVRLGWRDNQAVPPSAPDVPTEIDAETAGNEALSEQNLTDDTAEAESTNAADEAPKPRVISVIDANDDTPKQAAETPKAVKAESGNRFKRWCHAWWVNKKLRYGSLAVVLLLIVGLAVLPPTQAMALNLFGVRANASFQVLDATTKLPLSDAVVSIGSASAKSDDNGNVTLRGAKLGSQTLVVKKLAFVTTNASVRLSSGSNKLSTISLKPDGTQYEFSLTDYVTGKPVTNARASSGESSAVADKKGLITLTVKAPTGKLAVTITAQNYRKTTLDVSIGKSTPTPVSMVTADKEIYVSKQSGKYDVYKSDIDGQNKKVLLAGTGNESAQIALLPNAANDFVALVSTRDTVKDDDGYLLSTLTLINVESGATTSIDHSQSVQLVDWSGDKLIYVEAKAGASAANPSRYQLYAYDAKSGQRLLLDHANYFNDVVSAAGVIYYATSNQYSGGVSQFNKVNADSSGKQTLLVNEVWDIFRTGYSSFALDTPAGWYNYKTGDPKPSTGTAYSGKGHLYLDNSSGKDSIWVDQRDGKGALLSYDIASQKDTTLTEQSGLTYPIRWLNNDTIIYRMKTASETADYVISAVGGTPKKIADVTNTTGVSFFQGQ